MECVRSGKVERGYCFRHLGLQVPPYQRNDAKGMAAYVCLCNRRSLFRFRNWGESRRVNLMISVWEGGIYIPRLAKLRFPSAIWISYSLSPPPLVLRRMKCTMMNSALLGWVFCQNSCPGPRAVA